MDNKVTKKRINDHLEYDWFKYVIILIVAIVGVFFVFQQINSNRDYETLDIFVTAYGSADNNFAGQLAQDMSAESYTTKGANGVSLADKYGEDVLRNINLNIRNPMEKEYGQLVQTQGMVSSDALILGKKFMEGSGGGFLTLSDELLTEYLLPDDVSIDDLEYYYLEIPKLDEKGNPVKDSEGNVIIESKMRKAIRVDTFRAFSGTGSILEMDWRNIKTYNDDYKTKPEAEQPDLMFYLAINPQSVNIGKFNPKAKPQNAQALYGINRLIQYYRA